MPPPPFLPQSEYLDSFLENTAGFLKDLVSARKYYATIDAFQVASSKHLSRMVQAASVLYLDDGANPPLLQVCRLVLVMMGAVG